MNYIGVFINPPGIELEKPVPEYNGDYYLVSGYRYVFHTRNFRHRQYCFAIGQFDADLGFYIHRYLNDIIDDSGIARESYLTE